MYEKIDKTKAYGDREIIDVEQVKTELFNREDNILMLQQALDQSIQTRDALKAKLADLALVGVEPTLVTVDITSLEIIKPIK